MTNLADEGQVKEFAKKGKIRRERELADVKKVLDTDHGRRFVWRYLELCGVYRTSFTGMDSTTNFNEGTRMVGLKLMEDISEAKPDAYVQMMQDAKKREEQNA